MKSTNPPCWVPKKFFAGCKQSFFIAVRWCFSENISLKYIKNTAQIVFSVFLFTCVGYLWLEEYNAVHLVAVRGKRIRLRIEIFFQISGMKEEEAPKAGGGRIRKREMEISTGPKSCEVPTLSLIHI